MSDLKRDCIGFDETIADNLLSKRFRKRHRLGIACIAFPLGYCFFLVPIMVKMIDPRIAIALACIFISLALSYIHSIYRCPRCGTRPIGGVPGTTGILLFPKKCSKCKGPLLSDDKWSQGR
ncbi:hypothetical protein [Variovorax sp. JS1663]|uniref:hypothetical protein n=1 Tax=Variovorax sp. JS1663 TaxID=1851577 RepID=UPI00117C1629|nr:hypothetical protein [Variovorax sp. JS1663]